MAPRKKQASPTNSISQVPPPITTAPKVWLPPKHDFTMGPPIYTPSHTGSSTATLSVPDERSISTSSTATLPAPSERPANRSKKQDITQMPQATSAHDKHERECNIRMHEQEMRRIQHFLQERRNDFNKLQDEVDRAKRDLDRAKRDLDKGEWDKRMVEKLLKVENKLKEKEEECDILVTRTQTYEADYDRRKIPIPSLASPLQGTKRPHPDESQQLEDRNIRRRTETAKD